MGDNLAGPSRLLPPGWTSHTSPTGRTYYHNASTGVSTYTLPVPKPPKREKPIAKTAIPGANGWFKITTNRQNVFYFHPESKTSEWLPPPAVAAAVREMEQAEASEKERIEREEQERVRQEQDRLRREKRERKRKAEEGVPITEFDAAKRARADDDAEEDEEDEEDADSIPSSDGDGDDKMDAIPAIASNAVPDTAAATGTAAEDQQDDNDEDDEEWQRQIAEQMAAEAEAEPEPSSSTPTIPAPSASDAATSLEEQKSAFMAHLTSLNDTPHAINPMAPWDLELAKFSSHPSFLALPSREREDTFNEWCKLRIREKRAAKASTTTNSTAPTTSPSARSPSGEGAFLSLLQKEVRSTRTKFSDFKAASGRTPAFVSYGKGDGDREKLFRRHLVELGETKRRAAEAAEAAFLDLLSDRLPGNYRGKVAAAKAGARSAGDEKDRVMGVWAEAKKGLVDDKRYDAVGSSTRRFELFGAWARGERRRSPAASAPVAAVGGEPSTGRSGERDAVKAREKEEARARALAEREEKVRRERAHISRINRSALSAANWEEALLSFRQLLLDAVHSPHIPYHSALPQLARDPRFDAPGLSDADRERLFAEHQARLAAKEGERLGAVFSRYAKTLDAHPDDVIALALHDAELSRPPLNVYTHDTARLHDAYARWDSERQKEAEVAFKQMLTESAFVDFWGGLKKQASTTTAATGEGEIGKGEARGDEEEEATLLDMAKRVDLEQIESVLRNDARFRAWRHKPKQRETWIREHLEHLAAPKKSVHR